MAVDFIEIRHPKTGGTARVHPSAVERLTGKGWEVVEDGATPFTLPVGHPTGEHKPSEFDDELDDDELAELDDQEV